MIDLHRLGQFNSAGAAPNAGATRTVSASWPRPDRTTRAAATIDNPHADAAIALPLFYNLSFHRHLLELGGDGTWAVSAAAIHTNLQATILTPPNAVRATRERIAAAGLSARVTTNIGSTTR